MSTAIDFGGTVGAGRRATRLARTALSMRAKLPRGQALAALWAGLGWYPWLWAVLAVISALVHTPSFPIAIREPTLATVLGALVAGLGLMVLYIGTLRFSVLGQTAELYAGLGFGCLGSGGLFLWLARLTLGTAGATASWVYLGMLTHALAALLFTASIISRPRAVPVGARHRFGLRVLSTVGAVLVLGSIAIIAFHAALPPAVGPSALGMFSAGAVITGGVPDQSPWVVALNGAIAGLFIVASGVYAHRANHGADSHLDSLALTTTLIALAQVHALFAPSLHPEYVSVGDACMLTGYIVFLGGLILRLGDELSDHVSREERLRLSRELHDGLAQHLGLLHLRLTMATAPTRAEEARMRDLVTARRLTEVAILEARQAVMALRNESVPLDRFRQTVETFVGEFAINHDIQTHVTVAGERESMGADIQAEVLRILHEALSNAVRHGEATVVTMEIDAGPAALEIRVADNGRGFDPQHTGARGVGLASIRERIDGRGGLFQFRSSPGAGASLAAWIPVPKR